MTIIGDLAGILAFILFFRLIYLLFKCKKTKDWSLFKKNGIIFLVCFILASVFADTSSSKKDSTNKSSKSEKVSSELKKISSIKSSKISSESLSEIDSSINSLSFNDESNRSSESIIDNSNQVSDNTNMDHTAQSGKIIGNTKTHIYHTPDQHNYKISPKNEVVFNNEQDAINAGYRKALE